MQKDSQSDPAARGSRDLEKHGSGHPDSAGAKGPQNMGPGETAARSQPPGPLCRASGLALIPVIELLPRLPGWDSGDGNHGRVRGPLRSLPSSLSLQQRQGAHPPHQGPFCC